MSRVRADDYDAKYQSILDSAAALFADVGYPSAKMLDIAKACGASKSMLYHYFPAKDDLLLALLSEHLERLLAEINLAIENHGPAKKRLSAFVEAFVQKSVQSRQRHVSAMNDVKFLPPNMQRPLQRLQRRVIDRVAALLREVNPELAESSYKPYTMLLLGMLNWTDLWYQPGGQMKPQELCERISRLFLRGFLAERGEMTERPSRATGRAQSPLS